MGLYHPSPINSLSTSRLQKIVLDGLGLGWAERPDAESVQGPELVAGDQTSTLACFVLKQKGGTVESCVCRALKMAPVSAFRHPNGECSQDKQLLIGCGVSDAIYLSALPT